MSIPHILTGKSLAGRGKQGDPKAGAKEKEEAGGGRPMPRITTARAEREGGLRKTTQNLRKGETPRQRKKGACPTRARTMQEMVLRNGRPKLTGSKMPAGIKP